MLQEEVSQSSNEGEQARRGFRERLLTRGNALAYLPILVVVLLMFGYVVVRFLINLPDRDLLRYQCYALTFWGGGGAVNVMPTYHCTFLSPATLALPPLHALPLEYPPLTLLIFTPALLVPAIYYPLAFAVLMAAVTIFIYWLLLRYGPRGAALAFAFYMLIGTLGLTESRFDIVPAALTLLCVVTAQRKHWTAAYIALAFGFLLKIYPILFLPALFIAEQLDADRFLQPPEHTTLASLPGELWRTLRAIAQWRWKNALIFFGVIIVVTGIFAVLDFNGAVVSQLSYFAGRPVQVESTGSTLLFLGALVGYPVKIVYTFGSINAESALGSPVALIFEVLFVLGYLFTIILQWRGRLNMLQACIAILFVFIITGKVFSPQYLIWLIPLLVYSGAYDRFWLITWTLISVLTTFIYPWLYTRTPNGLAVPYLPGFLESVALRNALLVALTLAYLFDWFRVRKRTSFRSANNPSTSLL